MKTLLRLEPKQTVSCDYSETIGRPLRFRLEILYDEDAVGHHQFGVRLVYNEPSSPSDVPVDDDGGLMMDCVGYENGKAFFRMNDFLACDPPTYSVEVLLEHTENDQLAVAPTLVERTTRYFSY